jgi:hypothetical protein
MFQKSYCTIRDSDHNQLDDRINMKLKELIWELYGSPYVDKEGNYCQALVYQQPPTVFVKIVED